MHHRHHVYSNGAYLWHISLDQGPIFRTFFPWKVIFRGKFRGISWKKNNFSKLFPRKIIIFPYIFWGENFPRNFPQNFPRKKCTKNRPQMRVWVITRVCGKKSPKMKPKTLFAKVNSFTYLSWAASCPGSCTIRAAWLGDFCQCSAAETSAWSRGFKVNMVARNDLV
jgi:hypothetical protein